MAIGARLLRWVITASILLFGLLFLLLGLAHHMQVSEARKLVEGGAKAEAIVTAAGGRRNNVRYSYRFSADSRDFYAANRSIPWGMRDDFKPGDRIPVWYDRGNPERNMTAAELSDIESLGNYLFFLVAGGALLVWALRRMLPLRQRP